MGCRSAGSVLWGAVVALALAPPALAQRARGQELGQEGLVDKGYGFRWERPGAGWRLVGEAEARRLSSAAVAAATNGAARAAAVVIVEPAGRLTLARYAELVVANSPLEEKNVERNEPTTWGGQPAVRLQLSGKAGGQGFRYVMALTLHRGWAYQLVGWVPEGGDAKALEPLFANFSFVPGKAPGRAGGPPPPARGVGWRVAEGRFESVVARLRVRPGPGWRLLTGADLFQINPTAEVGLASGGPEQALLTISAERLTGDGVAAYAEKLGESFAAALKVPAERTLEVSLLGQKVELTLRRIAAGAPLDVLHGVVVRGDVVLQLDARWPAPAREAGLKASRQALAMLQPLPAADERALRQDLAEVRPERIGPDFALRDGRYQHFGLDFSWQQPEQGLWRVLAGRQAQALDPESSLVVQAPELGLSASLLVARLDEKTPARELHTRLLRSLVPPEAELPQPKRRQAGELELMVSEVSLGEGPLAARYRIATAAPGKRRLAWISWGLAPNVSAHGAALDEALAGLEVSQDLVPSETEGQNHLDRRLGYRYRPPGDDWTVEQLPAGALADTGAGLAWRRGPHSLLVVGMCLPGADEGGEAWFERLIEDAFVGDLTKELKVEFEQERRTVQVGGQSARARKAVSKDEKRSKGTVEVVLFRRGARFFALLKADEDGKGPSLTEFLGGFELVE